MVRHLNGALLPRRYRAIPQVHLGPFVETDLATFDQDPHSNPPPATPGANGGTMWESGHEAVQTLEIDLPAQDVFEVRVHDEQRGMKLVATVELVSPGNKDRAEQRQAFATKCAAYLQEQVNVIVVDIVTNRRSNLHDELLELLGRPSSRAGHGDLYAVTYRNRKDHGKWHLEFLPLVLSLGAALPTLPLWLAANFNVPIDLEKSYEETCQVLRID